MKKTAICILHPGGGSDPLDLEIPLNLPAEELIGALRRTFLPELREGEPESGFLRCENSGVCRKSMKTFPCNTSSMFAKPSPVSV